MYNIYADRLLGTGIVNHSVSCTRSPTDFHLLMSTQILQGQTAFYKTLLNSGRLYFVHVTIPPNIYPLVAPSFGLPLTDASCATNAGMCSVIAR